MQMPATGLPPESVTTPLMIFVFQGGEDSLGFVQGSAEVEFDMVESVPIGLDMSAGVSEAEMDGSTDALKVALPQAARNVVASTKRTPHIMTSGFAFISLTLGGFDQGR
jgi:hypothetical protein